MSRRRYFEEQRSGNGAIYHCVETEIEPGDRIRLFNLIKSNPIQLARIRQIQINDQRYVFMFSNRYEDVDCITSATESSMYHNDFFYIFA